MVTPGISIGIAPVGVKIFATTDRGHMHQNFSIGQELDANEITPSKHLCMPKVLAEKT